MLALLLAATTSALVLHFRANAMTSAGEALTTLALVMADQADRTFEAVELVEKSVEDAARAADPRTPAAFRALLSGRAAFEDLRSRIKGLPQIDALAAIDADGRSINTSRVWPPPPGSFADRDYFTALRADPALPVYISDPTVGRVDNARELFVARGISAPDGTFLGLILATVHLAYFEDLYRAVAPGPDSSIALFAANGQVLARFPDPVPQVSHSERMREFVAAMKDRGGHAGTTRQRSNLDGLDRLVAVHSLTRYPLVVTVTDTVAHVLAGWWDQVRSLIAGAVLLQLANIAAAALLLRLLHHQTQLRNAKTALAEDLMARRAAEAALALARERERAEVEMHMRDVRFRVAVNNMSQALCMFDMNDRLVVANPQLSRMFGLPDAALRAGMTFGEVLVAVRACATVAPDDIDALAQGYRDVKESGAHFNRTRELADGRSVTTNFQPVDEHGWLITIEDVTQRRAAAARIAYMAHHDTLTGLPNRLLFHERLDAALAQSRRGERRALLCLDLDHFKTVNDSLGHPVGDALLRAVTLRLRNTVREVDIVARLGGDEFAVIQTRVDTIDDTTLLARRIIEALSPPYDVAGHRVTIGVSIGIARIPEDGDNADDLLRNGDLALYRAKADGRGCCRLFEPEMDAIVQARRTLELELRNAFATGQFEVFYQPLLELRTLAVTSCEALLRWRHPERGLIPPARFVKVAEEIGLIVPLGHWVLRQACMDATAWPDDIKVNVNLSVIQFGSRTLVSDVAAALVESGLAPHRLVLEITETLMLEDTEATLAILHQLRGLGVSIAMDDFGTGYSSLSYLRRFPFDKVKIDRSFIEGLGEGGDSDAILVAVTDLCETLGIKTTAEGVETSTQLDILRNGKCTDAQGFLFSKPVPAAEVAALVRSNAPVRAIAAETADAAALLPALT